MLANVGRIIFRSTALRLADSARFIRRKKKYFEDPLIKFQLFWAYFYILLFTCLLGSEVRARS